MALRTRLQTSILQGLLQKQGVMLVDAHIDFGNGYHGTSYLNAHPFLDDPASVMDLAVKLRDTIPQNVRQEADIVVGPITGGALLAFSFAILLDNERDPGPNKVRFAPIYKLNGKLALRRHYRELIAGEFMKPSLKAVLIDDVCNTGYTLRTSVKLVEECGGTVLATAVVWDRHETVVGLSNHHSVEVCEVDPELVPAADCPQCKLRVNMTEF